MTIRFPLVDDQLTLEPTVKIVDSNLPERLQTTALNATYAPATGSPTYAATEGITGMSRASTKTLSPTPYASWITTFQAGHTWSAYGGSGYAARNYADTADGFFGPQSASLTTKGIGGAAGFLQKNDLAPIDFTGRDLVLPIKVDDWNQFGSLIVYLESAPGDFANHRAVTVSQSGVTGKIGLLDSNQWVPLTMSLQDFGTGGTGANISAITGIRLAATDKAGGALKVYFGGVGTVANSSTKWPNGVISLTFDDSSSEHWTNAAPKLSQYGFRGTMYPILDATTFNTTSLKILHDRLGWEVGGHATTNAQHALGLTGMTLAQAETEVKAVRQFLLDNGYEADTFAYPLGNTNAAVQNMVKKYFLAARATYGNLHETFPPSNLMNIRHIDGSGTGQVAALKARIDKIKAGKGWGVFTFHGIPTTYAGGLQISKADFDQIIDYIAAQGIPVLPVREVVRGFSATI